MDVAKHDLARQALQEGRFLDAEETYRQIVADDPSDTDGHFYLAALQLRRGEDVAAIRSIVCAIDCDPENARNHVAHGQILREQKKTEEAETAFEKALAIEPDNGDAYTNLGGLLFELGRYEDAAFTLRKALIYHPNHTPAATQLGRALLRLQRVEEAVSLFHAVLQIDPHDANVQINIGIGCTLLGDLAGAQEAFEAALLKEPDNVEAHVNYAHLLLLQGDFEAGYREHEWRLKKTGYRDLADFKSAMWSDEDLAGKTVLLWGEQGLGDTLQFVRYAPLVAEKEARVIVECNPILHGLIADMPGVDDVVDLGDGDSYDLHLPLMSLPLKFSAVGTPNQFPYLSPPPAVDLGARARFRVGLNWAGNPNHARDRERSRLLSEFKPLATIPNIDFYSLQVGPAAAQLAETTMQITDLATGFKNMSDTAAAMQALDLVISIDSAPAHLAGALGLPIWVLLTKAPDWRWGLENETTPWYPSMRIFRDQAGWDDVFDRVATALAEFAPDR